MNTKENSVNVLEVRGIVTNKYLYKNKETDGEVLFLTIKTNTVTSKAENQCETNYPRFLFFRDDIEKYKNVMNGDRVIAYGRWQTNKRVARNGKTYYNKTIVGEKLAMEPDLSETDDIRAKMHVKTDSNLILLEGEVLEIYTPQESPFVAIVTLLTYKGDRISMPQFSAFGNNLQKVKMINKGDFIRVRGHISTSVKRDGDENVYYQSIVADEIVR